MHTKLASNYTLQINIAPATVYISTNPDQLGYANICIKVTNGGSTPVPVNSIAITLPAALAPAISLGTVVPVASAPDAWNFAPSMFNPGEFDATPGSAGSVSLGPGDNWEFTLQMVTLGSPITEPEVAVPVTVIFGDGTVYSVSRVIVMAPAVAGITSFNSQISDIKPGETATLTWVCEDIDYCIISPIDGTHLASSGSLQVSPPSTTKYTLYAYGDDVILSAQWGITVEDPLIITFGGEQGLSSVNYGDNIKLVWNCNQFTESISITDDKDVNIPVLMGGANTPQQGSIIVGPITEPTTFKFNAFASNPQNFNQSISVIDINDVSCSLTATPGSGIWQKDKVTISWAVGSATSVSITPALENGPTLENPVGSVDIYPEEDVTYVISASGFVANVPGSTSFNLPLTVTPVQISGFTMTPPQIVAAIGGTNAAVLNWSAQAQTLSLDNGIGNVLGQTSYALTAPPDQTTYILSAGTYQNPGLCALPITVENGFGPFNGTIIPMDTLNISIPPSPYQSYIQSEMDYAALFMLPASYANLLPQTYYILEIDGVTADSGQAAISAIDPVLGAQLTPGRYLGYFSVQENTVYGEQITVPVLGICIKFATVAQYQVTVKIVTITPAT